MRAFRGFATRNVLVFFRNRQTVFFSMLAPLIVFALYVMFLRGNYVDSITASMGALAPLIQADDVDSLVNGLLLSGILGSSVITVPFGTLQVVVQDREELKDRDILATPASRWQVILGYFVGAAACALSVTLVLLTAGLLALNGMGSMHWTATDVAALYGLTALGTLSSTAVSMALMLLFKSTSACGAFLGILSAAAGFVIGAYIPVAQFSTPVQTFCNLWPTSGICCLMRQSLMGGLLNHIDAGIGGLDQGQFVASIREVFGFEAMVGGNAMGAETILLYVVLISAACLVVDAAVYSKVYARR